MTITVKLSDQSIRDAIRKLENAKDNLEYGLEQTVEILAKNGATIAQGAYGGMASADYEADGTTAKIITSGEANIIAEFGAGDAAEAPTGFENTPYTPVYPGSYSEENAQMYSRLGWWMFGGQRYTEVAPRNGLLSAKSYIVMSAGEVAERVIKL